MEVKMDFWAAIRELYIEKRRLDKVIATLEALTQRGNSEAGPRRGRKNMPAEERQKVSERMKRYWARRRNPSNPEKP
jgi:hypothetical protein